MLCGEGAEVALSWSAWDAAFCTVDAADLTPAELDVLLRGLQLADTLQADMRQQLSGKRGRWGCETIHRLLQWVGLRAPRTTKPDTCASLPSLGRNKSRSARQRFVRVEP